MVERSVVYVLGPLTPRSPLPEAGRGEGTLRVASWMKSEGDARLVVAEKPITAFLGGVRRLCVAKVVKTFGCVAGWSCMNRNS